MYLSRQVRVLCEYSSLPFSHRYCGSYPYPPAASTAGALAGTAASVGVCGARVAGVGTDWAMVAGETVEFGTFTAVAGPPEEYGAAPDRGSSDISGTCVADDGSTIRILLPPVAGVFSEAGVTFVAAGAELRPGST